MLKLIKYYIFIIIIPLSLYSEENLETWFINMSNDFLQIVENDDKNNLNHDLSEFIDSKFAINSISLSIIGTLANKNKKEDLIKYKEAFLHHLTKTLYNLVEHYDGQKIRLEKIEEDSNGFLVHSNIEYKEKAYSIVWRIVYFDNEPKILDIIIENTSYYVTKKSEFLKILRENQGSLSSLTKILEKVNFNY